MNYEAPALSGRLAAEYVVGTLRGRARRRFERLAGASATLRSQVAFWEEQLGGLPDGQDLPTPPAEIRAALMRAVGTRAPAAAPGGKTSRRHLRRHGRWLGSYAAGFATAAALMVAVVLTLHSLRSRQPMGLAEVDALLPIYAAQVGIPESSMQWLVSVSPDHRQLDVVAGEDYLQLGRHTVQLWCALPGGPPVPLGVLPVARNGTASYEIPQALRGQPQVSFIISLESESGSPSERPSQSILSETTALDGI